MNSTNLSETVELMNSSNYRDRFKAEYMQTAIRYSKLKNMVEKYRENKLDFTPDCPLYLLENQLDCMGTYLSILFQRSLIEKIDLTDVIAVL